MKLLQDGYNTTSAALAVLALTTYAKTSQVTNLDGVSVTEKIKDSLKVLESSGGIVKKMKFSPTADLLQIDNALQFPVFFSASQSGFDLAPWKTAEANGIEVFREYLNQEKQVVEKVKLGEEITVRILGRSIKSNVNNMAVIDLLPGGFEVVLDSITREGDGLEYVDAREDRVLIFSTYDESAKPYEYRIKATNRGQFEAPPIFAESMYDRSIFSKGISKGITVE